MRDDDILLALDHLMTAMDETIAAVKAIVGEDDRPSLSDLLDQPVPDVLPDWL